MKCINCGHENPDSARFCEQCGVVLPSAGNQNTGFDNGSNGNTGNSANTSGNENFNNYYQSQSQNSSYLNPGMPEQTQYQQNPQHISPDNIPEEYRPLGMWEYFGYQILFSIPLIGFIFLLLFAFGSGKNINLRNFARSYFCFLIITIFAVLLFSSCGLSMAALVASGM